MGDLFITEDLYRPGTFHEKENGSDESPGMRTTSVGGTLLRPSFVTAVAVGT